MGGDDLGDDDYELQYLVQPVVDDTHPKRPHGDDDDEPTASQKSKKKQKQQSPEQILLSAGRDLENQSVEQQAAFLTTVLRHYSLLENGNKNNNDDDDEPVDEILPKYCAKNTTEKTTENSSFADRIRDLVSNKKLKKWKHVQSPCVIIVCQSARRAVEILKQVADCKVRVAKLFPKNASVSEQAQQLSNVPFPIAVGTPHRLLQLCQQQQSSSSSSQPALHLQNTELIIIDCYVSNKSYTVLTLPDTAKHCAEWMRDHVVPQLKDRNRHCRVAFL